MTLPHPAPKPDSAVESFSILELSKYSGISPSFDIPKGGVVDPKPIHFQGCISLS